MSAWPERRRAAPLHALVARASAYLLRPPEAGDGAAAPRAPEPGPALRPVVAVVGLASRAGTSTLARALAGRLARLDPAGAAVLSSADLPRGAVASAAAARLARRLAESGCDGVRGAGRLALVPADDPLAPIAARRHAPLVADIGFGAPSEPATALADHVILVCSPEVEAALAAAVEGSLRAAGRGSSVVIARAGGDQPSELGHALAVPEAALAARLTLACGDPRGALAPVANELAERCLAEVIA